MAGDTAIIRRQSAFSLESVRQNYNPFWDVYSEGGPISLKLYFGSQSLGNAVPIRPLESQPYDINVVVFENIKSKGTQAIKEPDKELESIFNGLSKTWREVTGGCSITTRRYAHPSYQSILTLEPKKEVITLILKEMEARPDRWFEALKAFSKANPAQNATTFDESVKLWLEWGRDEGYIS